MYNTGHWLRSIGTIKLIWFYWSWNCIKPYVRHRTLAGGSVNTFTDNWTVSKIPCLHYCHHNPYTDPRHVNARLASIKCTQNATKNCRIFKKETAKTSCTLLNRFYILEDLLNIIREDVIWSQWRHSQCWGTRSQLTRYVSLFSMNI